MAGGARRSREDFEGSNQATIPSMFIKPDILPLDPISISTALQLNAINMQEWIASMSVEQLQAMKSWAIEHPKTGNFDYIIKPYYEQMEEFKNLQEPVIK